MTAVTLRQTPPQPVAKPEQEPPHEPRHAKDHTPFLQKVANVSFRFPKPVTTVLDGLSARVLAPIRSRPVVAWAVGCLAVSVAVSPWLPLFWLPVASSLFTGLGVWAACSYRIQEVTDKLAQADVDMGALRQENNQLRQSLASDSVLTQMLPQIRGGDEQ